MVVNLVCSVISWCVSIFTCGKSSLHVDALVALFVNPATAALPQIKVAFVKQVSVVHSTHKLAKSWMDTEERAFGLAAAASSLWTRTKVLFADAATAGSSTISGGLMTFRKGRMCDNYLVMHIEA